jgi:hypothetical protein
MDISASRHNALTYLEGMLRLASASKMGMLRLASASKIGADMEMLPIRCRRAERVRLPGFSDLANIFTGSSTGPSSAPSSSIAAGVESGMLMLNSAGTTNLVGMLRLASASKIGLDMDMLSVRIRAW